MKSETLKRFERPQNFYWIFFRLFHFFVQHFYEIKFKRFFIGFLLAVSKRWKVIHTHYLALDEANCLRFCSSAWKVVMTWSTFSSWNFVELAVFVATTRSKFFKDLRCWVSGILWSCVEESENLSIHWNFELYSGERTSILNSSNISNKLKYINWCINIV